MSKRNRTLKDSSLVFLCDLREVLNILIDKRLHRFMSYKKLKEYIKHCVFEYNDLSAGDKKYLENYFFSKPKGDD